MKYLILTIRIVLTICLLLNLNYDANSQNLIDCHPMHTRWYGKYGCGNLAMINLKTNGRLTKSDTIIIEKSCLHDITAPENGNLTVNIIKDSFKTVVINRVCDSLKAYFNIHKLTLPATSFPDSVKIGFYDHIKPPKDGKYYAMDSIIFFYRNAKIGILAK